MREARFPRAPMPAWRCSPRISSRHTSATRALDGDGGRFAALGGLVRLQCGKRAFLGRRCRHGAARQEFPHGIRPPHAPWMVMVGASLLWVGWFGFNAGSALSSGADAGMALLAKNFLTAYVRHTRPGW